MNLRFDINIILKKVFALCIANCKNVSVRGVTFNHFQLVCSKLNSHGLGESMEVFEPKWQFPVIVRYTV